ncbi:MAG TPA: DUF2334 domain-containing protein [Pyrinomonadaceae bacterium]
MSWLLPIKRALDMASAPVNFFFRNDDAGWSNDELSTLLDLFESQQVAIDVAVIPQSISPELLDLLRPRLKRSPHLLDIHQHGYAHTNHELTGRKCEFGNSRSAVEQLTDIRAGKLLIEQAFGGSPVSIFTPPWNRCTATTANCLREAGFQVLSRDSTATPLRVPGLFELPISIDWFAKNKGERVTFAELGTRIVVGAQASSPAPVGIMLHHELLKESDFNELNDLLSLLSAHQNATCQLMKDISLRGCGSNVLAVAG